MIQWALFFPIRGLEEFYHHLKEQKAWIQGLS